MAQSGRRQQGLTPEDVQHRSFSPARRGFDVEEVQDFLALIAGQLRESADRERALSREIDRLETRLKSAETRLQNRPDDGPAEPRRGRIDEAELTAALGAQAADILRSAHQAADEVTSRADEYAAKVTRDADDQAAGIRRHAEGVLARREAEAEIEATKLIDAARLEALAAKAVVEAETAELARGNSPKAKALVDEAMATRERILSDLAKRRRVAQAQIEQLKIGRERLLDAYRVVRRTLDEVTEELQRADTEARATADATAARRQTSGAIREEWVPIDGEEPLPEEADERPAEPPAPPTVAASTPTPTPTFAPREPPASAAAAPTVPSPSPSPESVRPPDPVVAAAAAPPEPEPVAPQPEPVVVAAPPASPEPVSPPEPEPAVAAAAPPEPDPVAPESEPVMAGVPRPEAGDRPSWQDSGVRIIHVGPREGSDAEPPAGATGDGAVDAPPPERSGATVAERVAVAEVVDVVEVVEVSPPPPPPPDPASEPAPEPRRPAPAPPAPPAPTRVAAPASSAARPKPAVDELFARLRAGREEAVARAQEVLSTEPESAPAEDAAAGVERRSRARRSGAVGEVPVSDQDESLLQTRDALVEEVQEQLVRKLKRALQDEQNDLLDRLRGLRQQPTVAALLGTADEQADRYRAAALPFLTTVARSGAQFVSGDSADRSSNGGGGHGIADVAETLGVAIVDPLRNRLERVLANGGDDTRALADDISNAYREWKSQRIAEVAADHVTAAFGRGSLSALLPGTPVRWLVDDQDGPCPDCDDNALARPTPAGESFPTGQRHPPAHRGCRCVVVPDDGLGG